MNMSCFDVANQILWSDSQLEESEGITPLKLQKLVYYCQGFHLAMFDVPFFHEEIKAWKHGPVVPSLYSRYKHFEGRCIDVPAGIIDDSQLHQNQIDLVTEVVEIYGQFSAWRLRNMTHEESPWIIASKNGEDFHGTLSIDDMKSYFKSQLTN